MFRVKRISILLFYCVQNFDKREKRNVNCREFLTAFMLVFINSIDVASK